MTRILPTRQDYGIVSDISRAGNELLGDHTGRTITQRTQDGMYNLTNGAMDPSGVGMHAVMLTGIGGLASKSRAGIVLGILALLVVFVCWLAGRDDRF